MNSLKITMTATLVTLLVLSTHAQQATISRPWNAGFGTVASLNPPVVGWGNATGYWEIADPNDLPSNPGAALVTGHYILQPTILPPTTTIITPKISGILNGDSLSFDVKHWERDAPIPVMIPAIPNAGYVKVYVSNNGGTSFTQIDSFTSTSTVAWEHKKYSLAAYAGNTVCF